MNKRIIFCVTNDLNYDQRMHRICSTLQTEGYAVELVGRKLKNSKQLEKQTFSQKRLRCIFNKGKLFYLEINFRLFFYLLFSDASIFVANDIDTILAVYFASILKNKKRVFDAHELFSEVPELAERPMSKAVWRWLEKMMIPRYKTKYTVSESIAKYYLEIYQQQFNVIRNVPLYKKTIEFNNDSNIILYQGALNDGRGLAQMIDAMQEVHDFVLWIAGRGDIEEELKNQVKEMQLENKIKFLGVLSPLELESITINAKIGINLLENKGLNYYYSLANKFFDYMQVGIPTINMAFPEYIKINKEYETTILIDDLSKDSILEAVNKLRDKQFYQQLQLNCNKAKEVYTWENESKKLIEIYDSLKVKEIRI